MKIQKLTPFVSFLSGFLMPMAYGQTPSATARDVISEIIEQAAKETSKSEKPVTLPPGLPRFCTKPEKRGSVTSTKTMGRPRFIMMAVVGVVRLTTRSGRMATISFAAMLT